MCRTQNIAIIAILVLYFLSIPQPSRSQESELKKAKVDALYQKYMQLNKQGSYQEAIQYAIELVPAGEEAFGKGHPNVAIFMNNLAALYKSLGDYAKAEPLYKQSLAIREKALGPEHPDVALGLNNLAGLYKSLGDYAKAEPLYKRFLAIVEKAYGPEHPHVATSLNTLAGLYKPLGDYAKAEPLYKRSLAIREKALGPEHPHVATSLNNLAGLYASLGDYAKAEPLYKRSLAIREKALGPEHPYVATSLNNLAGLYASLGDYAKAEPLYKRSLAIDEKAYGPDHPDVATSLSNLALLYASLGDYTKAEPLYKRSLAIDEKAYGPDHPDVAGDLNNLAGLYYELGEYAKAEPLYKRSLAIDEKAYGPEHPYVARGLNNLALLYASLGDYTKAEPLYKRSLAIDEKAYGPDHPDVAGDLNNLALLYKSLGENAKAEPLYKRSLVIYEKAYGPDHPDVATSLSNLALLYVSLGKFRKAHDLLKRGQMIDSKIIDQVMGFTSEQRKIKFLSMKKWSLYLYISLIGQYFPESPSIRKDALDVWFKRKGVILETQKRFQEALVYSDDPEAVKTFHRLAGIRVKLSKLAFGGPGKEGVEVYKKRIVDMEAQKEKLEARLSQLSHAFAIQKKIAKADSNRVARALPKNTALLEFTRIERFDFKAKGKEKKWLPPHYMAFVLHAGKGNQVGMINLGDALKIERAIAGFKKEITKIGDIKGVGAIESSRRIYDLVFANIKKELRGVKKIFISPDGNLNLIPFEVLQGPDRRFLIEDYTFNYLTAGRDVLRFGEIKEKGNKALLMGDPDFDMGTDEKGSILRKLTLVSNKQEGVVKRSSDMGGLHFGRLPETKEEVNAIKAILGKDKADIYTGKDALEEALRQKGTPSILHLATHGFFLNDLDLSDLADETMARGISISPKPGGKKIKIENPLLRSGIALAGANNALKSQSSENNTGIVTAEKILGLRLRGTDMVVLSACDTGLGEVKAGEGVFGLRRAFTQAGAKSLVMSMWSVPDRETKELMVEFYKNIQSGKMNRSQALRQAALKEMKVVRERYGYANPYYWGAFVFMGEP